MSKPETVQDMIEMFTQEELARVGDSIAENLDMNPVTRYYYDQFVREGLPILKTAHTKFETEAWIKYIGHRYSAVEVYDRSGELKYSIPAMLKNLDTPTGIFEERYTDHIQELMSLRADNPMMASVAAYNALTRITADDEEAHIEDGVNLIIAVNKIFKDHDIPELSLADFTKQKEGLEATEITQVEPESQISDDFEEL